MRKNYRFEILAALSDNLDEPIDILPLINSMMEENMFSRLYFKIILQSMHDDEFIRYTDYGDEIKATLLAAGVVEYRRLRRYHAVYGFKKINTKL